MRESVGRRASAIVRSRLAPDRDSSESEAVSVLLSVLVLVPVPVLESVLALEPGPVSVGGGSGVSFMVSSCRGSISSTSGMTLNRTPETPGCDQGALLWRYADAACDDRV
jgi:hypothetical protein